MDVDPIIEFCVPFKDYLEGESEVLSCVGILLDVPNLFPLVLFHIIRYSCPLHILKLDPRHVEWSIM
jgi:hypothetical protein